MAATNKLNEDLLKAYIGISDNITQSISSIKEFITELRVTNDLSRQQDEKRDKLIETLVETNNKTEGRLTKIELILENQEKIMEGNSGDIKNLQDERNFNTVKFANAKMPVLITSGITALICATVFSLLMFMKDNNIKP